MYYGKFFKLSLDIFLSSGGSGISDSGQKGENKDEQQEAKDFKKAKHNASIRYLKRHSENMKCWRSFTLKSLIDKQDCAVEAVKLEWLLRNDKAVQFSRK
jgi:hypothetical protein